MGAAGVVGCWDSGAKAKGVNGWCSVGDAEPLVYVGLGWGYSAGVDAAGRVHYKEGIELGVWVVGVVGECGARKCEEYVVEHCRSRDFDLVMQCIPSNATCES